MKKALVLTLAGAMIFSTPVMAKEVGAPEAVYLEDNSYIGVTSETVRAIAEDKTIMEHTNNAVTDHWDMDSELVQDLAIGKGAVLDGKEAPGLTFELLKPELKRVYAAKTLAQGKGSLLAVANVHTHAGYKTAKITFYAPGVKAGDAITVYQRVTDDEWTAVPTVVTDNHVAVEITDNTHLAFIKAPVTVVTAVQTDTAAKAVPETAAVTEKNDTKTEVAAAEKNDAEVKAETAEKKDTEVKAEAAAKSDVKAEVKAVGENETKTEVKAAAEDETETEEEAAKEADSDAEEAAEEAE